MNDTVKLQRVEWRKASWRSNMSYAVICDRVPESVMGGCDGSWIFKVIENPEMTPEAYRSALNDYRTGIGKERNEKEQAAMSPPNAGHAVTGEQDMTPLDTTTTVPPATPCLEIRKVRASEQLTSQNA
jgi:hypothetical protein